MVSHETICPYFKPVFFAVALKGLEIESTILIFEKDVDTVITALGNVVRVIDCYGTRNSWHAHTVSLD